MKSTLGGALAAFGTFLFGVPYMLNTMSADFPKAIPLWCMGMGLLFNGLGIFFTALFSADSKEVSDLTKQVESNRIALSAKKEQSEA